MLIVPYGWDQPDNAARVQRLGVELHLARNGYAVDAATSALMELLKNGHFAHRAAEVRARLAAENGLATACTAIESILTRAERQIMLTDLCHVMLKVRC